MNKIYKINDKIWFMNLTNPKRRRKKTISVKMGFWKQ